MIIKNVVKITYSIHGICFKNKKRYLFYKKKTSKYCRGPRVLNIIVSMIFIVIFEEMAVLMPFF